MSDHHDAEHDPIDQAYIEAEAMLSDEAARAARRARVLAAVASEAAPVARRPAWRRGGWLVAASVAGVGLFVATQIHPPPAPQPPPATRARAASPSPSVAVSPPTPARATPAAVPRAARPPPPAIVPVPPPPPPVTIEPAPQIAPAPAPAPPPPSPPPLAAAPPAYADSGATVGAVVVTAQKRAANAPARTAPSAFPDLGERLRDAAAAGRAGEVKTLLTQGAPIDAPDADGDTALMKAVQADHPAAAALLRRHGASLDRKNNAGESARDMAAAIGDAALSQTLGLETP